MEVKKIGSEFARDLGRLEAEIYPPEFRLGWRDFLEDLEAAEAENGNFSLGLFSGRELIGYLVAYREGDEVFISDLAILPEYRIGKTVVMLLEGFMEIAAPTNLPIVAECRECSFGLATRHPDFLKKFGYALEEQRSVMSYGGEPSWAVRLEKVPRA